MANPPGSPPMTRGTAALETAERTPEKWLRAHEVSALFVKAGLFRVPRSTLTDWADAGKIAAVRTAGGHRRYRESDARALLAELAGLGAAA
jgi:excisionase family DNA binding protein